MDSFYARRWLAYMTAALLVATVTLYVAVSSASNVSVLTLQESNTPVRPAVQSADTGFIPLHPEDHSGRPPSTTQLFWNITKGQRRPDGVAKSVYLVNDAFPGPTIGARSGDTVIITVQNQLEGSEGTALHWHGLRVSNEMDGVVGVTQKAMMPGESFTYELRIPDDQYGSFWYHSHFEEQRADGLFGAFVVHRAESEAKPAHMHDHLYEDDRVLMVGDFHHRSAPDILAYYRDWKNFKIEPAPDSLLLNGRGYFNCSRAVPARPLDCEMVEMPKLTLTARRTRLRIVNTGSSIGVSVLVEGYSMTLLAVDGGSPASSQNRASGIGILYPGERVDVLLEAISAAPGQLTVALDRENMRFPNLALSPTQHFPLQISGALLASPSRDVPLDTVIDLSAAFGSSNVSTKIPEKVSTTILLYSTISYLAEYENRPKGFINRTSWDISGIQTPLSDLARSEWPSRVDALILPVQQGDWVDVVLNNMDDKGHPFHLHGQDFYVLALHKADRAGLFQTYNPFDAAQDPPELNLRTPLRKDTVLLAWRWRWKLYPQDDREEVAIGFII
ncbi:hypothetical protein LTR97_012757 [Elasticomyces elasticus]|uniref:Laccase n=1 Tax=Elasticomyces elasticus TaxID=574655 RepID=A0AAN7VQE6_9PEZI|nr:hypothetical protein LTR97_012757 [Elasticomyces elasticus]